MAKLKVKWTETTHSDIGKLGAAEVRVWYDSIRGDGGYYAVCSVNASGVHVTADKVKLPDGDPRKLATKTLRDFLEQVKNGVTLLLDSMA